MTGARARPTLEVPPLPLPAPANAMKLLLRASLALLNVGLAAACLAVVWPTETNAVTGLSPEVRATLDAPRLGDVVPAAAPSPAWLPPAWFPEGSSAPLMVLPALDGDPTHRAGPKVRSPSAIVADLDRGEVLWARDPDGPRSIASVTKLFSALAVASTGADLDREHCVGLEQWPSRPGARSKFSTGDCRTGWDFLGGALVASDNRGAFALPTVADEDYFVFVDRMEDVARELGAEHATFADPAGLEDENMASARDVLKAVVAVAAHPELSIPASAPEWRIAGDRHARVLGSTNRLANRWETLAAKTGYTDTAKYCFATVVRTKSGRNLAVAVLGAPNSGTRFADTTALVEWAERQAR